MEFHVLTDGQQSLLNVISTMQAIEPYIDYFHIREKHLTDAQREEWIQTIKETKFPLQKLIINDSIDLAARYQLGGVHLPEHINNITHMKERYPYLRIGSSVHSLESAHMKVSQGADYVIFGHIFATDCKKGIPPRGTSLLTQLCRACSIPIIAIGGVDINNLDQLHAHGTSGIAMMSGIMQHHSPKEAALQVHKQLKELS